MKKSTVSLVLFAVSLILFVAFAISSIIDYLEYYPYGSAPFYLYVLIRIIQFMIPSIICFLIALILKHKQNN